MDQIILATLVVATTTSDMDFSWCNFASSGSFKEICIYFNILNGLIEYGYKYPYGIGSNKFSQRIKRKKK